MGRRAELARLIVTPDDESLFWWLVQLRVMTFKQVRRLRYSHADGRLTAIRNVRSRLSRLRAAGYLETEESDETTTVRAKVFRLGEKALPLLQMRYDIVQGALYRPRGNRSTQLEHDLLISEVALRITESLRGSPVSTPALAPLGMSFYTSRIVGDATRRRHTDRYVTQADVIVPGEPRPFRVRPDLVFALRHGQVSQLYFLELDRGSEGHAQIAEKQIAYHYYAEEIDSEHGAGRKCWQRYLPTARGFRVLFVTTSDRRIEGLSKNLERARGFDRMAFTTIARVKQENPIYDPIWMTKDGSLRALLKRAEQE